MQANRVKAKENLSESQTQDVLVLDALLDKLINGDKAAGIRTRRKKNAAPTRVVVPIGGESDAADIAKDLLAQLNPEGFEMKLPLSPTYAKRRLRQRRPSSSAGGESPQPDDPGLSSPVFSPSMTPLELEPSKEKDEGHG